MADDVVRLMLDLDTDPAEAEVKSLEGQVDKSAKAMSADMKKVQTETDKVGKKAKESKKSWLEAGQAGGKAAGLAGAGFAGLAGGIGVATASAESFETAMVGAGSAIASGFASGGPVGAGIAAAGVGIGLLVKHLQEAERYAKEAAEQVRVFAIEVKKTQDAALGWIDAYEKTLARQRLLAVAQRKYKDATDATVTALTEVQLRYNETEKALAEAVAKQKELREEAWRTSKLGEAGAIENQKIVKQMAAQDLLVKNLNEGLARAEGHRDRLKESAEAEAKASKKTQEAVTGTYGEAAGPVEAALPDFNPAAIYEREKREADRREADAKREQERIARVNRDLERRLEIGRAVTDEAKDLLRIEHEMQDLLASGADEAKVAEARQQRITDLTKEEAKARKEGAKAEKSKAAAAKSTAAATRAQAGFSDVTKGFQHLGGTGLFGFGAAPKGPRSHFLAPVERATKASKKGADAADKQKEAIRKLAEDQKKFADAMVDGVSVISDKVIEVVNRHDVVLATMAGTVTQVEDWNRAWWGS